MIYPILLLFSIYFHYFPWFFFIFTYFPLFPLFISLQEVSLADVRKEISFCQKTNIPIIGILENMSSFVCPHCKCQSQIFEPSTGGAEKLCLDYKLDLLGKVPLDPLVVKNCDRGIYVGDGAKDSKVMEEYAKIGEFVVKKTRKEGDNLKI